VCPTTSPARRIVSTWADDLISTPRSSSPIAGSGAFARQRREHPCGDVVDGTNAVYPDQQAALVVLAEQRGRLVEIDLLSVPDDLLGVVTSAAGPCPVEQPDDQLLGVDRERYDGVDALAEVGQDRIEGLDLVNRPRVPIQHKPRR